MPTISTVEKAAALTPAGVFALCCFVLAFVCYKIWTAWQLERKEHSVKLEHFFTSLAKVNQELALALHHSNERGRQVHRVLEDNRQLMKEVREMITKLDKSRGDA